MRTRALMSLLSVLLVMMAALSARSGRPQNLERNKAVARQLFEVALNQADWDVYLTIHSPDFVAHAGARSLELEQDLAFAKGWRQAFPDGRYEIIRMIAEGDLVAVYWAGRGTHTGAGNSLPAGTGRRIDVTGVTILRVAEGHIVEEWNVADELSMLRQLGLLPADR